MLTCCASTPTLLHQFPQQSAPLLPEEVGPRQAAISTNHTQVGDAVLYEVVGCLQTPLAAAELFAAGTAYDCATLVTAMHVFKWEERKKKELIDFLKKIFRYILLPIRLANHFEVSYLM